MKSKPNYLMFSMARKVRRLTQKELAEGINVTQSLIFNIENGIQECSIEHLRKIASFLKFPMEFFYKKYEPIGLPITFDLYKIIED